jgi:hypothetical protein
MAKLNTHVIVAGLKRSEAIQESVPMLFDGAAW